MSLKEQLLTQLLSLQDIDAWQPYETKFFGSSVRSLSFFGDVSKERAQTFISQLLHLCEEDEEEPITVWLNTSGGSLTDGLAIYDTIKNISCPVLIYTTGLCASAGLIILCAGDYRIATESTVFYYHQPVMDDTSINSSKDMDELQKFYNFSREKMDGIIKQKTKLRKATWNKYFEGKTSYYFSSKDALKFKLIDKIAESNKLEFELQEEGE